MLQIRLENMVAIITRSAFICSEGVPAPLECLNDETRRREMRGSSRDR